MAVTQDIVGMAEIKASREPIIFSCLGLGSCLAIIAFDPTSNVSGIAHVMLPQSFKDRPVDRDAKFVDTAIPALLNRMMMLGANRDQISIAIVGGAQVFQFGAADSSSGPREDLGARNVQSALDVLSEHGLSKVVGQDTGGTLGRAVTFNTESGEVRVRTLAKGERILCKFEMVVGGVECRQP